MEMDPVKRRNHNSSGFTLIELMIVIAIVAILVMLAVPAYNSYTIRAKVTECIHAAAVPKLSITEFRQTTGRWPSTATEAAIDQSFAAFIAQLSHYCHIFFYNNGEGDFGIWVDSAEVDASLEGLLIIPVMSPVVNSSGNNDWYCTYGFTSSIAIKYLPSTCRVDNIF